MAGHVQAEEVRSFRLKKSSAESKARLRSMLKSLFEVSSEATNEEIENGLGPEDAAPVFQPIQNFSSLQRTIQVVEQTVITNGGPVAAEGTKRGQALITGGESSQDGMDMESV